MTKTILEGRSAVDFFKSTDFIEARMLCTKSWDDAFLLICDWPFAKKAKQGQRIVRLLFFQWVSDVIHATESIWKLNTIWNIADSRENVTIMSIRAKVEEGLLLCRLSMNSPYDQATIKCHSVVYDELVLTWEKVDDDWIYFFPDGRIANLFNLVNEIDIDW